MNVNSCNECPYIILEEDAIGKTGEYKCGNSNKLIHNVMVQDPNCPIKNYPIGRNAMTETENTNDNFKPCCGTGE
jgi:hypothetical protein